jgi:putative peptide zinc metalloprotease protein
MSIPAPLTLLPPIRQELALHPGPSGADGAPTWTLHDPVSNQFYQISWPAFEILSRWRIGQAAQVLDALQRETLLQLGQADVEEVAMFLTQHNLLAAQGAQGTARLLQRASASRMGKAMWLLKHYLFFRVPLVRPMPALKVMLPRLVWLFTPQFWAGIAATALLGLYLVSQQWDSFMHTFTAHSDWQGLIGIGIALSIAKVAHELGHAFTAYRHGCRVPNMGVAFMVLVPMLYTDTNEAWKLPSRRARLQISSAGMAVEIALAACATLLWSFLPDGPIRAGVFLLATSTWLITLAINLSPFMRFDGYFLLCDWLELPNLHERSFALGRWRLREWLFGWGDAPPEDLPPRRQWLMTGFAYATWLYRLVLFLGIALLVYHLFFKALGVLLLVVELGWFIAYPVGRECKVWWMRRAQMRWNTATRRSLALVLLLLALVCVPWPRGVQAPAALGAQQAQWLYAPAAAQVRSVGVALNQQVKTNQVLLELDATELHQDVGRAQAREQQLGWQLAQQALDPRLQERGATLRQRWEASVEQLAGLQALSQQQQMRAGFDGVVVNINPSAATSTWVARGERLLQVATTGGIKVDAYVDEADLPKIAVGNTARFIADEPGLPLVRCEVASIDRIALSELEHTALSSPFGGPIAARADSGGRVQPRDALFRVRLQRCTGMTGVARERMGSVVIGHAHQSYVGQWLRDLAAVLQREGGL